MKVIVFLSFWAIQCAPIHSIVQILDDLLEDTLYFGQRSYFNTTIKECIWRNLSKDRALCPKEVTITLFANGQQEIVDTSDETWLTGSKTWDRLKPNIFTIHGYAGGDNSNSYVLVREAFVRNGQFNLFVVDYGPVSRPPCYVAMVNNMDYVSYCISSYINQLHRAGMPANSITLIGHSIGAHICGYLTKQLNFRVKKIIGLDPALPLITDKIRLNRKNAERVHTLQTNAGFYGDLGAIGHVDICVNNGNKQPFCEDAINVNACSHFWSLCFMAQSLFHEFPQPAEKCSEVCPHYTVFQFANQFAPLDRRISAANQPNSIIFGVNIPESVEGSYCLTAPNPPFCPKHLHGVGNERCCSYAKMFE